MVFERKVLCARDKNGLDTEVRFLLASAVVDGCELLALLLIASEDDDADKRALSTVKRILSVLKREGRLAFYIDGDSLTRGSTEAEFLQNKYPSYLELACKGQVTVYVKL